MSRSTRRTGRETVLCICLALLLACGNSETGSAPSSPQAPRAAAGDDVVPASTEPPPRRLERPLPAFEGFTLDGDKLSARSMLGRRLLLFVFNPDVKVSDSVAEVVQEIAPLEGDHNFRILGIGTGASREAIEAFRSKHGLGFPVIDDSSARIANRLQMRVPVALAGADAEGYVLFSFAVPETANDVRDFLGREIRDKLRLPTDASGLFPMLGEKPLAPALEGIDLDGQRHDLAALRGEPVVLVFFLHTCPHCHNALRFMKSALPRIPEEKRPTILGISLLDQAYAVRERMRADGLDFLPILLDRERELAERYGATRGVPEIVLIDADGRIDFRSTGWDEERDPALFRMRLAKLAGTPVPMLLHASGYSGNQFCAVCHEDQQTTWELTNHAFAFDTLVRHAADRDGECVSCHVVGYGEAGGYDLASRKSHLEDVGCETCHGRGGPHLSPGHVAGGDYEQVCITCHDQKHSLGFEYSEFVPKVSHAANAHLVDLSLAEKQALLAERGKQKKSVLPTDADYVGSEACRSCHEAEFETWASNPHAKAGVSLAAAGESANGDCLTCHTTGYGSEGGFPPSATLADHPDLGRVGCESCHGPGGAHVAADAPKRGTITSLGDKCDSCVILQICGSCHDEANDPGFEFVVQEKIDRIRHGTIEAGTGKPKSARHRDELPPSAWAGALEHAWQSLEPSG